MPTIHPSITTKFVTVNTLLKRMKHFLTFLKGKKQGLFVLAFSFLTAFSYGQSNSVTILPNEIALEQSKIIYQDSLVKITVLKVNYTNNSDGISHERLTYAYENLSSRTLILNYSRAISYDNQAPKVSDNEIQIELAPNSSLTMTSNPRDKRFYTFSKDLKLTIKKQLTKVELNNITLR
jgi:hypothetical protein